MKPQHFLFLLFFVKAFCPQAIHAQKLFNDDDILHFKLVGKLNELLNDRDDKKVSYHPVLLQYLRKDSSLASIQLKVETRGHFRRDKNNCSMPPLLLNFSKLSQVKNTVFEKQNKLKLVTPCRGDEYVIYEWLVYKLYNLVKIGRAHV